MLYSISMEFIDQGVHSIKVRKASDGRVVCEATRLTGVEEMAVCIGVNAADFLIRESCWEISRSLNGRKNASGRLEQLIGEKAYFGMEKPVAALTGIDAAVKGLLKECMKGIIQAETYITKERGFSDRQAYEKYWDALYEGKCRFYHCSGDVRQNWVTHVGSYCRAYTLFNRHKSYSIIREGACCRVSGIFIDSYHQLAAELSCDIAKGIISGASASFIRFPRDSCAGSAIGMASLCGRPLPDSTKEIAALLGGAEGCFHLVDLVGFMVQSLGEVRQKGLLGNYL